MKTYLTKILLLIAGLLSLTPSWGQADTLCSAASTGTYYVQGWSGSTFTWDAFGNGIITGQGNDTVTVVWTSIPGNYQLHVFETSSDGCPGIPQILQIIILPNLTSTTNQQICANQLPYNWNGEDYFSEGTYIYSTVSVQGCDSLVTLNLEVENFVTSTDVQSACGTFTWIDGNTYSASTNSPTYTYPGGSVAGCDSVVTLNLTINSSVSGIDTQSACGSFTWIDGSTYSASTNSPTYTYVGGSIAGCDSVVTLNLIITDQINTNLSAQICNGASYTLPDGSTVSSAGVYPITLQTSSGCDSIITTTIALISVASSTQNVQICAGQTFNLPGGGVVNSSDTYVTTITSSQGCDSTITTILNVIDPPTFTQQINICEGGFFELPDGIIVSSTDTYESILQTNAGCDSIIITNLFVQPQINDTISITICQGDSYLLPNGNAVNTAGEYTFNEISITGCDSILHYIVQIQIAQDIVISEDTSICQGQILTLFASGANQYTWIPSDASQTLSGDSISIQPDATIQYSVTAILGSCSRTDSVLVTVNPSPTITINPNPITICLGDSIQLIASGSDAYNWTTNSSLSCDTCSNPIAFPDSTQTFTVTGNIGSCADTSTISIQVIEPIQVTISGDTSLCFGDSLTLIARGGQSYIWSTNDTTNQITISPSQTGIITVIANSGFCTDTGSFSYDVWPSPYIHVSDDTTIHYGGSAQINVLTLNEVYWSPSNGLSCTDCPNPIARPQIPTTYCAFTTNAFGCKANDCIKVNIDTLCPNLFIPNVFSPAAGGNSENDCFKLYGADCIKTMELTVFNRWGEKVFFATDINECWDGKFKGKDENTGVFIYYLNAKLIDGEELNKQGNVTLLR